MVYVSDTEYDNDNVVVPIVVNPSLYNEHWCKQCIEKITFAQKVIYNGLCFVCLDEIKERDEEKKSD